MDKDTKYRLKSAEELTQVLSGVDNLFVITCNKCFREFDPDRQPDCADVPELAKTMGKTVAGMAGVDFLCNKLLTAKTLETLIPEGADCVAVAACGLGIQTVAELVDRNVVALTDSVCQNGHRGMALTQKACDACAQCYLNITGGICPVVDCSKSLLNGQCGGAKNGKCEVSPDKDCAWEKIQQRLEAQGRLDELKQQPVQVRDYSKVNVKVIRDYVESIRQLRFDGYCGGVHPVENKERTEHLPLTRFPAPDTVVMNLAQHAGAPAKCVVSVGDAVKVGQKIGEADGYISANIHASVSGKVIAIEERRHATRGDLTLSVVIENDRQDTLHESVKPQKRLEELTSGEIVEIIKEAGIVGMGGAGFPMNVKLMPGKPVDTVLLNGCECEPMLTADHRVMLEYTDDVLFGLRAMMKAVGAEKGVIVIEDNKPDAIARMREKTAEVDDIEVCAAKTKYPQGAEKMLIKKALGRQVPSGGLPADVGCVVANVSTSKAVSDAIQYGMPLVERAVTVTGEQVNRPGNFLVRIGTGVRELLAYCGCDAECEDSVIKIGGPMMGAVQEKADVATTKCSNGIIVMDKDETVEQECIRCGRCVDVCPMELKPLYFAKYAQQPQILKEMKITDCMECRCCEYICSSKIPLTAYIKTGKTAVKRMK